MRVGKQLHTRPSRRAINSARLAAIAASRPPGHRVSPAGQVDASWTTHSSSTCAAVGRACRRPQPLLGRRRQSTGARSDGDLHRHRDQTHRLQPGLHPDRTRRPRVEREVPARGADGSRRIANPLGRRLPSAPDLLRSELAGREGDRARIRNCPRDSAKRIPRSTGGSRTPASGPTTRIPLSARASSRDCSSCRRCSATRISKTTTMRPTCSRNPSKARGRGMSPVTWGIPLAAPAS